eukprot:5636261-Prymnesium_polylepis.1
MLMMLSCLVLVMGRRASASPLAAQCEGGSCCLSGTQWDAAQGGCVASTSKRLLLFGAPTLACPECPQCPPVSPPPPVPPPAIPTNCYDYVANATGMNGMSNIWHTTLSCPSYVCLTGSTYACMCGDACHPAGSHPAGADPGWCCFTS